MTQANTNLSFMDKSVYFLWPHIHFLTSLPNQKHQIQRSKQVYDSNRGLYPGVHLQDPLNVYEWASGFLGTE